MTLCVAVFFLLAFLLHVVVPIKGFLWQGYKFHLHVLCMCVCIRVYLQIYVSVIPGYYLLYCVYNYVIGIPIGVLTALNIIRVCYPALVDLPIWPHFRYLSFYADVQVPIYVR